MPTDFAIRPPEVNSALMYAGPGARSLQFAAASWEGLATDLQSTAASYRSVISVLSGLQWQGPSSAAMMAAVMPYVEWLNTTAAQVEQTATQAAAAVVAFERAFAMTVPPPVVAANRAELAALIATNFFGQNSAAIAATEALYAEMWARDAAAMHMYEVTSAAATALTPFTSPPQTANSAGVAAQSVAVTQATAAAGTDGVIGATLRSILNAIEALILPLAPELVPAFDAGEQALNGLQSLPDLVANDFTVLDGVFAYYATFNSVDTVVSMGTDLISAEKDLGILPDLGVPSVPAAAPELLGSLNSIANTISGGGLRAGLGVFGGDVSAAARSAGSIGQLSVPPAWAKPVVTVSQAFEATPLTTLPAGDAAGVGAPGIPGLAVTAPARSGVLPRYGVRPTVMSHPLSGG
jgi:PPE-repeat protein